MGSNLPPAAEKGVFSVTISKDIDAPIETVWDVLLDFPKYNEWNPFVRSMTVVSATKQEEADQAPVVGKYLLMKCHIPPTTSDKPKQVQKPFEVITTVDTDAHRVAWRNIDYPGWLLRAERWQALSRVSVGDGHTVTRYETTEVFAGILAYVVRWLLGDSLRNAFEEMAKGLKSRAEQS